jgi:hypothetical protein
LLISRTNCTFHLHSIQLVIRKFFYGKWLHDPDTLNITLALIHLLQSNTLDEVKIPNNPPPPFLSFLLRFLSDTVPFRLSREDFGVPLALDVSMTEVLLRSSKGMSLGIGKPDLYLSITALESYEWINIVFHVHLYFVFTNIQWIYLLSI